MFRRVLLFLVLVSIPAMSSPAQVPPRFNLPPAEAYAWHMLPLRHALAPNVIKMMHWDKASINAYPFRLFGMFSLENSIERNQNLPSGVNCLFALADQNALMIEATDDGLAQVQNIIKVVDIAAHGMTAKVAFLVVATEKAELNWENQQALPIEIAFGSPVVRALDHLLTSGRTLTIVETLHEYENEPLEWIVPGYMLSRPRLYSDDSLTLLIGQDSRPFASRETPRLQRGGVLAVKQIRSSSVTFIKVDY